MNLENIIKDELRLFEDDYRGRHRAPSKDDAPLHDMTVNFPENMYSNKAASLYGDGLPFDQASVNIIQNARNKPNQKIKIYRAVPMVITNKEKIDFYEKHKAYIMKYGKLPNSVNNWSNKSEYYEFLCDEIERLKTEPQTEDKVTINTGDWVTINLEYAKTHGKSNLNNSGYRILSKTVLAKQLNCEGSIHEWGYNP